MKTLIIAALAILSTAHADGAQRQPDHLSLITALVAETGRQEGELHIFNYDCVAGRQIGWLSCTVEYTALGIDDLLIADNLGVKAE